MMTNRKEIGANELNQVNGGLVLYKWDNREARYIFAIYDDNNFKYITGYTGANLEETKNAAIARATALNVSSFPWPSDEAGNEVLDNKPTNICETVTNVIGTVNMLTSK